MKRTCSEIKIIYFDLGNVILPTGNKRRVAHKLSGYSQYSRDELMDIFLNGYLGRHRDFWNLVSAFDVNKIMPSNFYKSVCRLLRIRRINYLQFKMIWQEMFSVDERFISLIYQMGQVRHGIISDLSIWHYEETSRLLPLECFYIQFFSFLEGRLKKDEGGKTFEKALDFVGANGNEVVFIDDRIENIEVANSYGINTFLYQNNFDKFVVYLRSLGVKIRSQ